MKTDDEQFDDFLKSKMTEESFTFEEQYWQKASGLLDEARPKRKRFFVWIVSGFVLSVTLAAIAYKATENKHLPKQTVQQTPVSSPASTALKNTTFQPGLTDKHTPDPQTSISYQSTAPVQPSIKENLLKNSAAPVLPKSSYANKSVQHQKTAFAPAEKSAALHTTENPSSTLPEKPTLVNQMPLALANEDDLTSPDLQVKEIKQVSLQAHWAFSLFNQQPVLTPVERIFPQNATVGSKSKPAFVQNNLFVEAGLNWFNAKQINTEDLGAHIGLSYAFPLRKKLGMSIGLGYTQLHQSTGTRYYATVSYGFGEQRKTTGIKTVRLDYAELPVLVNYAITPKQGVFAGASLLYVLHSIDYKKNDGDLTFGTKTANYFKAYQPIDAQLILGYHCWLSPKIRLSAGYHYGLTDITQNTAFKRDEKNKNKGFRFTIGYQLF